MVAEKKLKLKRSKKQFTKKRDKKSPGAIHKSELKKDKITLGCQLLTDAVKNGFIPDFVLTDTWFTCAKLINLVRSLANGNVHFLGMIKAGPQKFLYDQQEFTLNQLRKYVMLRQHRCSRFKSRYVLINCTIPDIGQVRILFQPLPWKQKMGGSSDYQNGYDLH